jgi:uncharacterized protein YndB with AHSA1/START domain
MLRKIALAAALLLGGLALLVGLQPSSFAIERSALVEAPPERIYAQIADLRAMDAWSPWARMDPQMKIVYSGPASGVGARSSWRGPQMGEGRLTVTAVRPPHEVELELEMLSPMPARNRVRFTLVPAAGATRVTWRMEGHAGFLAKAMHLVMDMEEMVGGPFERGLAALEARVEGAGRSSV